MRARIGKVADQLLDRVRRKLEVRLDDPGVRACLFR
jgi:hypothetical protein